MEIRVKSLRVRAYFRFFLIGSSGGLSFWLSRIYPSECVSHRFLFLTVARLNRASLVSAVKPLLPFSTKYDFYFIPKHFSPAPTSHATETKNRYDVVSRGDRVYQDVSLSTLEKLSCIALGLSLICFVCCRKLRGCKHALTIGWYLSGWLSGIINH